MVKCKQDILNMTSKFDVMATLKTHPELWDEEVKYYAITCGVYGAMVHTAFCGENDHIAVYEAMKQELADFIDRNTTEDEEYDFYDYFTSKY